MKKENQKACIYAITDACFADIWSTKCRLALVHENQRTKLAKYS